MIDINTFKDSNLTVSAHELIKATEDAVDTIHSQWENSPSEDVDGREDLFREIRGIRMGMLRVIRNLET